MAPLEQLITTYSGVKTNNMKSSQTNLGVFSIGVEQSNNDCKCDGIWETLEIIAVLALFFLVTFLLFQCISAYCKKRKNRQEQRLRSIVEILYKSWNERERENNRVTVIDIPAQAAPRPCPREHLHLHDDLSV